LRQITEREPIRHSGVVSAQKAGLNEPMADAAETPEQRRTRYLHLAAEAESAAKRCATHDLRDAYSALARSWTLLARDVTPDKADET
jgi:hypothetical protein